MADQGTQQDELNDLMKQRAIIFAECEKMATFAWSDDYPDFGLEEDEVDAICSNLDEIAELARLYWEQDNAELVRGLACPTACASAAEKLNDIFDTSGEAPVNDSDFSHEVLDDYAAPPIEVDKRDCFLSALKSGHPIWDGLPTFNTGYNNLSGRLEALLSLRAEGVRLHNDGGYSVSWVLITPYHGIGSQLRQHDGIPNFRFITPHAVRMIIRGYGNRVRSADPSKTGIKGSSQIRRIPQTIRSLDPKSYDWLKEEQRKRCGALRSKPHRHRLINDKPVVTEQ